MRGNIVIYVLLVVVGMAILMTSGMLYNKSATDPNQKYDIDQQAPDKTSSENLQIKTLKFKRNIPATFDCGSGAIIGSNEPYILWAIDPPPGTAVGREGAIKAFYQDEWPLTLGKGNITLPKSSQDHVVDPNVGDESARDANNFPYFPALFLSDITTDPNNRIGDAQNGGIPHKPNEVFGEWKPLGNSSRNFSPNNFDLGPGADPWPADPNVKFTGVASRVHGPIVAEVIWNVEKLGLEDGHTYRAQFILHDGDKDGDISEGCTTIQY